MGKHILNRGGETTYSAPTIEIIDVRSEKGFAATGPRPEDYGDYQDPGKGLTDDIYGDF